MAVDNVHEFPNKPWSASELDKFIKKIDDTDPGVELPARQQRVKAICDLARLASEVYCIIIIINNTRGFLEIRCLYSIQVHRDIHVG